MQINRTLIGTFGYLALVSCAYGAARGLAHLTGWESPAALVTMTLAAFIILIILASHVYARFKRPETDRRITPDPHKHRPGGNNA